MRILGERKIIELVLEQLERMPNMLIPFGDDVSAYPFDGNRLLILKTDMLVDKTDMPKGMSFWQAARKAVVMNVSDFAAKGVKPRAILVSLGLPKKLARKDIAQEIGRGLNAGAREYGTYIIGGDTGEASDLVISISLFSTAKKGELMLRSGAKAEDIVAVTGFFGKTAAGLKVLLNGCKVSPKTEKTLTESVLMPRARLKEGLSLSKIGAVTASIDSSDGLAWSLHEIAKASKVGFLIDRLPVAEEVKEFAEINQLDPLELALYGGEEYELVVTVKHELWKKAKEAVENVGGELLSIGKVTAEREIILKTCGKKYAVEPRGWEHFRR